MMKLALVLLCLGLIGALAATAASEADASENAKLAAFFKTYLDKSFRLRPLEATKLGDHRFDDQLDDVSAKGRATWVENDRNTLRELPEKVDYSKLTRDGQIDFEILKHHLTRRLWL